MVYLRQAVGRSVVLAVLPFATFVGCGSSPAAQPSPVVAAAPATSASAARSVPAPAPDAPEPAADSPARLPVACEGKSSDLCTPPGKFIERLCIKPRQDLALWLFARSSPFTRLYLKAKVDELLFDEEVVALRFHGQPKGGMIVGSGNGTYDVLRWDGSCSTGVEAEEFARARPPNPRAARVLWHRVGERTQSALIASSDAVKRAHAKRGKECKGAMTGDVSAACERADAALADAIVDYVRSGGALPEPEAP
jgi:hypothetical protein